MSSFVKMPIFFKSGKLIKNGYNVLSIRYLLRKAGKVFTRLSWAQILVLILWFETCEDHSLGRKQTNKPA